MGDTKMELQKKLFGRQNFTVRIKIRVFKNRKIELKTAFKY